MISLMKASASNVQYAQVRAHIVGADGKDYGEQVLDHHESWGHKLRRLAKKTLPFLMVGLMATAALAHHPEVGAVMPAATVITNGGQAINTNLVSGIGGTVPRYVAWGTGAGTAAASDTTLFTESSQEARTNGTVSRTTTTVTNDTLRVVGLITVATSGKTITNVGIFDASSSGNLFLKSDFTGLALLVGDSITFTIDIKYS